MNTELQQMADSMQFDFFGVASLSEAADFIHEYSDGLLSSYPFAVSLGVKLQKDIVDLVGDVRSEYAKREYSSHAYQLVNDRMNLNASMMASYIQRQGYGAFPVAASQSFNDEKIHSIFSHKLAAHLSGHGWIGKSCMLITRECGPRVRWVSILTDMPLEPTGRMQEERCGDCRECVDICPVGAYTGRAFDPTEPREMRLDAAKCQNYFTQMGKRGETPVCGLCLYVCPHGRKEGTGHR